MTKFFRNNSKKLLALFMVILMVAFILPTGMKYGQQAAQRRLVGHLGDEKIYDTDLARAKHEWDVLENYVIVTDNSGTPRQTLIGYLQNDPVMRRLIESVQQHPELFFLLQKEAERMGVVVTPAQAEPLFQSGQLRVMLPTSTRAIVPMEEVYDLGYAADVRAAVAAYMKVKGAEDRIVSTVKLSDPMVKHLVADSMQEIRVRVVELPAKNFVDRVEAPTDQQLEEHFNKFANYPIDTPPTADNPHGFGYRYLNRAAIQYVEVPRDLVKKAVRARQPDDRWDVDARKYYLKNMHEFPSTQPTEPPATKPADAFTLGSTRPSAPAAPTTRPYEEVRQQIEEKLMAPEVERKAKDVQDRINARLAQDYEAFRTSHVATTAPTTGPADAGGYASYEYLQKLAQDIEKQTGVLPTVASIGQAMNAKELAVINGIGQSTNAAAGAFSKYASEAVALASSADMQKQRSALAPWQPSLVLKDLNDSTYVFRVTEFKPSAKPQSLAEVKDAVERDWKLNKAYELAKAEANKMLDAARSKGSLEDAARDAHVNSTLTGWFGKEAVGPMAAPVEGLPWLGAAQSAMFRNDSFGLLSIAAAASTQPTTEPSAAPSQGNVPTARKVVELASDETVFAVELAGLRQRLGGMLAAAGGTDAARGEVEREMLDFLSTTLRAGWFDYNSVVKRTGWKDESGRGGKDKQTASADAGGG